MQETKPSFAKGMKVKYVDDYTNTLMIAGAVIQMIKS